MEVKLNATHFIGIFTLLISFMIWRDASISTNSATRVEVKIISGKIDMLDERQREINKALMGAIVEIERKVSSLQTRVFTPLKPGPQSGWYE